jgi:PiT family inorganic phosphate transporter
MFRLLGSVLLGWGLGANDSANIFGTAVSSRAIRYSSAISLSALFIILGAFLQGHEGIETISTFAGQNQNTAFITTFSAALCVMLLTIMKLPISTSQAVVGAIIGTQLFGYYFLKTAPVNLSGLTKIILCWLSTPLGGFFCALAFYKILHALISRLRPSLCTIDQFIKYGLIFAGCYGAYALGANNVANVTGVFVGENNLLTPVQGTIVGGFSIALGVVTYSKNVMNTIGKNFIPLDGFSALVTVLAHAAAVHIFAVIGVPVSSSQAIVGAVIGIGFIKNIESIHYKTVLKVLSGWFVTPLLSFVISFGLTFLSHMRLDV